MGVVEVARQPRAVPRLPGGELSLEPPPEPERPVPPALLARLLPAVMLLGSVGFLALGPRDPSSLMLGGMFALSTVGMLLVGGGGRSAGQRQAAVDEERRDYLRYLAVTRRRVRTVATEQRAALEHVHPDPAAWPAVLAAGRLWERRGTDPDFGVLRAGTGPQRLATTLVAPQTGPVEGLEPVTALALRRFLRAHAVVPDLPVALSLRGTGAIWLETASGAGPEPARALARALVAQYVLWHSPADALLAVVAPAYLAPEWEWVKWLPHAGHPRCHDAAGPVRMVTAQADDVRRWWEAELAGRAPGAAAGDPHLLVVVDEAAGPGSWAAVAGTTVLRVGAPAGRRPAPAVVRLLVGAAELSWAVRTEAPRPVGRPDALSVAEAAALARRLAGYRPAGAGAAGGGGAPAGLPELLGLDRVGSGRASGAQEIDAVRERRTAADRLHVPIGVDEAGGAVGLDLKESAEGGSGPHGLCVGATGSGKSELLRTLVLGLAATHSSAELNFVLVDFKGGATFLGLGALPHVSAVITNLAEEVHLVDRMAEALAGEITRRQELLRAAGNLTGMSEYAAARRRSTHRLPALPALLVVVDEFSELLAQRPELVDLLGTIGRLGRSLGIHLLLASQRLDEGRLRGLDSHLSYRIALRTFSAAESRAVLGVPDAHQLPPAPGSAFLATGSGELVRFRAAYVSGPLAGAAPVPAARSRAPSSRRAHLFRVGAVGGAGEAAVPASRAPDGPTVLDAMVAAMAGQGPPAHRVWLSPLGAPPCLDELLGRPTVVAGRGLAAPLTGGTLQVPVGVVDRPYLQRRDLLTVDLTGATGHLVVVGGPRSGKSGAVRTVLSALALTHSPVELGMHVLDFGGGGLAVLADLPHVGTVTDRRHPEVVRRAVAEVTAVLARRELLFRTAGVGSIEEFRARRAAGEFPDEPATDVLLVVDGYLVLRGEFDDLEVALLPLVAQGLSYGVHLVVSAGRWSELRPALKDLLGSRLELRLGEPGESEVDRRRAAAVPARPGHGLAPTGAMVLAASWLSEHTHAGGAGGGGTGDLVAAVARAWTGRSFPAVAVLPDLVHVDDVPAGGAGIPIGVDEEGLAPVAVDLGADPHLVCFADDESGKTTLLRLLARGLVRTSPPAQVRVVVVDYRRGLLDAIPPTHLLAHASTADAAAQAARDIAASLRGRLPGADVGPRELRERSWWSGPEVVVLVDDYDLVAPAGGSAVNPLLPLVEFLPQARDVGLHLVVARRCGGAGRALFDPLLGRLRELGAPGLVMNGSPDEGALVGTVKPRPLPPGRAVLVDRRRGSRRVQLAWVPPDDTPDDAPVGSAGR